MLIGMVYRFGRRALGPLAAAARSDRVLPAEVLALRQENAVLRRQIARVRYEPADRAWFAALSALAPVPHGHTIQASGLRFFATTRQLPDTHS